MNLFNKYNIDLNLNFHFCRTIFTFAVVIEKSIPIPWIPLEFQGIGMESKLKIENF
jgi:hypothetical protein